MIKISVDIKEPVLLNLQSISDDRGLLVPVTDDIDDQLFRRCYFVEDYGRGVIRGLHYHRQEIKVFTIVSGAGKFVTVKLDPELATGGNNAEIAQYLEQHTEAVKTFVLSSRHHGVLVIPPFFANGWISLEEHTVLVALSNLRYEQARDDDLRLEPGIVQKRYWEVLPR